MNNRYVVYVLIALLYIAGCATTQETSEQSTFNPFVSEPPPDKAYIYIYRPSSFYGAATNVKLRVNKKDIANMGSGSYFPIEADAGSIELEVQRIAGPLIGIVPALVKPVSQLTIDAEAGETYYVKIKLGGVHISGMSEPTLTLTTAEDAKKEASNIDELSPRLGE